MLQVLENTIQLIEEQPALPKVEKINHVKNFFHDKKNKSILFWMHFFTFIAFLIITISINEPINKIFTHYIGSHFRTFQFSGFFQSLFEYSALAQPSKVAAHDQLFKNYQTILFGAVILLTADLGFLFFDFVERRKRLNLYRQNMGVYAYPHMDKWCKDVIKSMIDCSTFMMKTALLWLFLSFAIMTSLISGNIFEHNFFLCALQFLFAIWMFSALLIMYNYYDWYTEYYMSFVKYPKYEDAKEGVSCLLPKFLGESLLSLLFIFAVFVSLPYDLVLIYLFFKHIVTKKKFSYKERTRTAQAPEVLSMLIQ